MNAPLNHHVAIYTQLKARLVSEFGLEEDDEALLDTLEGETDLQEACIKLLREASQAKAFAEAMRKIIADNQDRKARHEAKAERLRAAVTWAMQEAGLPKITAPDMTVSWRMGKANIVTRVEADYSTSEAYPDFTTVKAVYAWNKDAIAAALDAGKNLPFAHLSNPQAILTVRSK